MKLRVLEIPSESSQLAGWLDAQLASFELPEMVADLLAIHGLPLTETSPENVDIESWLGAARDSFLRSGTAALSTSQRKELLTRPALLLSLQELVDMEGSGYWNNVTLNAPEVTAAVSRGRTKLQTSLALHTAPEVGSDDAFAQLAEQQVRSRRRMNAVMFALTVVAAGVLIGFFSFQPAQPPAVAWGWNEKDLLKKDLKPAEYLTNLADAGDKWFKKRPETKSDVTKRLKEMQQGCQRLIAAEHKPLNDEDRTWLLEKCKAWASKFEAQLAALEKGTPPLEVRDEVDKVVNKLVETLRARASERAA